MAVFIDTHCHLDAPEFGAEMPQVRARAQSRGVALCVMPAVAAFNFAAVRELAHRQGDAYALGMAAIALGAGRTRADQAVDPSAGMELCAQRGERVTRGQPLAIIHARTPALARSEAKRVERAFQIASRKPQLHGVVLERITR